MSRRDLQELVNAAQAHMQKSAAAAAAPAGTVACARPVAAAPAARLEGQQQITAVLAPACQDSVSASGSKRRKTDGSAPLEPKRAKITAPARQQIHCMNCMFMQWKGKGFDRKEFPAIWIKPGEHKLRSCKYGTGSFFKAKATSHSRDEVVAYQYTREYAKKDSKGKSATRK